MSFVLSTCTQDNQFEFLLLNESQLSFDDALLACQALNDDSQLASLPDSDTTDFVNDFLQGIDFTDDIWIGLQRPLDSDFNDNDDLEDPSLFSFLDGTEFVDNFAQTARQDPWRDNQPDNDQDDEACVA